MVNRNRTAGAPRASDPATAPRGADAGTRRGHEQTGSDLAAASGAPGRSTTPQRSEATGTVGDDQSAARAADAAGVDAKRDDGGGGDAPYRDLKLPHERDESAERDTRGTREQGVRPVVRQGADDLATGKQDTDCYNATAPRYERHRKRS